MTEDQILGSTSALCTQVHLHLVDLVTKGTHIHFRAVGVEGDRSHIGVNGTWQSCSRVNDELNSVVVFVQTNDLRIAAASEYVLGRHSDGINQLGVILATDFRAGAIVPLEELTGETSRETFRSVVSNTSNSLVFSREVTHLAADVARGDSEELEMLCSDSGEVCFSRPGNFDDVGAITLRLGNASAGLRLDNCEVMVVTHVDNDEVVA